MEQSPSWENNRFSASQHFPRILLNSRIHYHIQKSPLPVPTLSQINPPPLPDRNPNVDVEADLTLTFTYGMNIAVAQRWLLRTWNTSSRVEHASFVHRLSCKGRSSAAFIRSQNFIRRTRLCGNSSSSGLDGPYRRVVFGGRWTVVVPVVQYCLSFSTTVVLQLPLLHLYWLVSDCGRFSFTGAVGINTSVSRR
jgi:hypothetical protein